MGVRGQGSTVHLGRAGVVGLWVWEVGRRGSVRERGGVGEAGGRNYRVGVGAEVGGGLAHTGSGFP